MRQVLTKVKSCEPHVDISTTSTHDTVLPCASPSNSSRLTMLPHLVMNCLLCLVALTMKLLLPLVLVLTLTM